LVDKKSRHSFIVTAVIQHMLTTQHDLPNAFGAQIPVDTTLNVAAWEKYLRDYHDRQIVHFL
jgi:hypothetical protein